MKNILWVSLLLLFYYQAKSVPKNVGVDHHQITFTENKGQIHDQSYKPRPDVLFGAMAGNMAVHIRNNGVSYQLYWVNSYKDVEEIKTKEKRREIDKQTIYRIDLNWLNANKDFTKSTDETLPGYNNFYLENCPNGALNVKSYTGVSLKNLYKGISLHYYEKEGNLKYDYIVAPHANYKHVQIEVKGAGVLVNNDGSLTLTTPLGKVNEGTPIVFQKGKQLKAKWLVTNDRKLNSSVLSFDIENVDPNYELIIDPLTRVWGTYYGGIGNEDGNACKRDASDNVFLVGTTSTSGGTIIATVGAHQATIGGSQDAFLVKFNSSGLRLWGTYYGGSSNDLGYGLCSDMSGNIYITGTTNSSLSIATIGAHQGSLGGGYDAFLAKFDNNGVRLWATYYGGTGSTDEAGRSCSTDASGNVFLVGETSSSAGTVIATIGSHQPGFGGGSSDGFLVKFNSSGLRQWGTYYGGSQVDRVYSCDVDGTGNVFIVGITLSSTGTVIASAFSHQTVFGGGVSEDAFVVKFNTSGLRLWGTYYGGNAIDQALSCSADGSGNIYVSGYSSSTSAISTVGSHQTTNAGSNDAFLVKFNTSGVRQWGTYYGGSGQEIGYSCSVDGSNNVYLSGRTASSTGTVIASPAAYQSVFGGGALDAFFVKFNPLGIRQWGSYYGGSSDDHANAICLDSSYDIYLVGTTASNTGTIIASAGSHQQSFGGGTYDAFLAKFKDCVTLNLTSAVTTTICFNAALNFSASITGTNPVTYTWSGPNSFTSNLQNPIISNSSTLNIGIYTVSVNNPGCGIETATTQVSAVFPLPTISINSGSICSGNSFTLIPNGANTYTIEGGNTIVTPSSSTSYTVIGTSTAGCLSNNTATSNVSVYQSPTVSVNSGSICSGNSFTILPSGASSYTIQGGNYVVSPGSNTSYTVIGTSTAGCLSNNTATSNVTVNQNPTVTVNSGSICSGNSFTILPSGASSYTIQGGNNVVSPGTSSSYTVIGTSSVGCLSTNTATSNVTVNQNPTVSVVSTTSLLCLGQTASLTASGASSYTWSPGGVGSQIVVSPTVNTNYTVTGTDMNGCQGLSVLTQSVSSCNSLAEVYSNLNSQIIKTYPNPTEGKLYVSVSVLGKNMNLIVVNSLGQIIEKKEIIAENQLIDLSGCSSGIYFIQLRDKDRLIEVSKIIKK